MTYNQYLSASIHGSGNIRIWTHGEFPMPDWVAQHMAGGIESNGTFMLATELGRARVHLGNVIIERYGAVWVRAIEEASDFVESLKIIAESPIANVGPGKVRQFGSSARTKSKAKKTVSEIVDHRPRYSPPAGSQPSIEWIHLGKLSIDDAYQRSTDNEASRRLIASIAAKFDWRLRGPLVVSRRADDTLTIIDGQHRWMAASKRDDIPQLPCCIFRYESTEEEARMFILANRARKPMNRLDDYFAALAAADEDALEIQQLVAEAGLRVARNTSSTAWLPGEVAFTSAIAKSVRRFRPGNYLGGTHEYGRGFPRPEANARRSDFRRSYSTHVSTAARLRSRSSYERASNSNGRRMGVICGWPERWGHAGGSSPRCNHAGL
jgi:ParB-like nuclease family protein